MSRKGKLTSEERIQAVQEYMEGKGSYAVIAEKYGIKSESLRIIVLRAKNDGIETIGIEGQNRKYSRELKYKAIQEYLTGKGSQPDICLKYGIKSKTTLQNWIKCYNRGKDLKERTCSERGITMNKGRKTTQEERTEIVAYCIENGKDYGLAMKKYGVSYQQIYSWVRKYEEKGVAGLTDRRGKAKPEEELTETDRLRMENKILQAKLKDQEMEIAILKKLKELRGGGR